MSKLKDIIFEQGIYLASESDVKGRLKVAQAAKERGFERFGTEFLFIRMGDVSNLDKQATLARMVQKEYDKLFDETYFSIHFPWIRHGETAVETSQRALEGLKQVLEFLPEVVSAITLHVGIVSSDEQKNFDSPEKKRKALENLSGVINDLNYNNQRVCVESILQPADHPGAFFYAGMLPSDFKILTRKPNVGVTLDTCHAGVAQYNCQQMVNTGKLCEGLAQSDWPEVKQLARDPIGPYLPLGNKIWQAHFSDYKNRPGQLPLHGPPFPDGERSGEEMWDQLRRIRAATNKKPLGATLEIIETDYANCTNMLSSLDWIHQMEERE